MAIIIASDDVVLITGKLADFVFTVFPLWFVLVNWRFYGKYNDQRSDGFGVE